MVVNVGRVTGRQATATGLRMPVLHAREAQAVRGRRGGRGRHRGQAVPTGRPLALTQGDPAEVERSRELAETLTARLDLAADQYAEGCSPASSWHGSLASCGRRSNRARESVAATCPRRASLGLVGPDAAARWSAAPLDVKRTVIEMLCTVTILPSGPGKPFEPESDTNRVGDPDGPPCYREDPYATSRCSREHGKTP